MAGNDGTGRFGSGTGRVAVAERGGTSRIMAAARGSDRISGDGRPETGTARMAKRLGGRARETRGEGSGFRRLLPPMLWLLPVLVVGMVVVAWYSDRIAYLFAAKPHAGDIAGAWVFDETEFAHMADAAAGIVPAGPMRVRYRASLDARAAGYRGVTWTFDDDGYTTRGPDGEQRCNATYEGYPPNALAVKPAQGRQIAVLVGQGGRTMVLSLPVLGIPFKRAP